MPRFEIAKTQKYTLFLIRSVIYKLFLIRLIFDSPADNEGKKAKIKRGQIFLRLLRKTASFEKYVGKIQSSLNTTVKSTSSYIYKYMLYLLQLNNNNQVHMINTLTKYVVIILMYILWTYVDIK